MKNHLLFICLQLSMVLPSSAYAVCIGDVCRTFNLPFENAYENLYPESFAEQTNGLIDYAELSKKACDNLRDRIEFEVGYEDKMRELANGLCLAGGIQRCGGPCGEQGTGSCDAQQSHEREYIEGLCSPPQEAIDEKTGEKYVIPARCDCHVEIKCSCRCEFDPLRAFLKKLREEVGPRGFDSTVVSTSNTSSNTNVSSP